APELSAAPAPLPLVVHLAEAVVQPLAFLAVGGVGKPVAELVLLVPQSLTPLAIAALFTVARRPRLGRISGPGIGRRLGVSRRRHRSSRAAAIADQLTVVVADISDAM